jgi:hypothetical protein
MITEDYDNTRYRSGSPAGHYESYFLRANHPAKPQAFWIRYTIFSPAGRPQDAIGELWAVVFDGATGRHHAAKTELPIDLCAFRNDRFAVRVAESELGPGVLAGCAGVVPNSIAWNLQYTGGMPPVFDLPLDKTPITASKFASDPIGRAGSVRALAVRFRSCRRSRYRCRQ